MGAQFWPLTHRMQLDSSGSAVQSICRSGLATCLVCDQGPLDEGLLHYSEPSIDSAHDLNTQTTESIALMWIDVS